MPITTEARRSLVTCAAAGELFALDVAVVERVLRYTAPSRLPNSLPWLVGVISVGEKLVPVLDLRERLGLSVAAPTAQSRIVVLTLSDGAMGFIVDTVHEVTAVDGAMIEDAPAVYRGLAKDFVQGIVRRSDKLYILLAADQLVTSKERLAMRAAVEDLYHGR